MILVGQSNFVFITGWGLWTNGCKVYTTSSKTFKTQRSANLHVKTSVQIVPITSRATWGNIIIVIEI